MLHTHIYIYTCLDIHITSLLSPSVQTSWSTWGSPLATAQWISLGHLPDLFLSCLWKLLAFVTSHRMAMQCWDFWILGFGHQIGHQVFFVAPWLIHGRTFQVTGEFFLANSWSKRYGLFTERHFRSTTVHSPSSSSLRAGMPQSRQTGMFSISLLEFWGSLVLTQDFWIIFFDDSTFQ